MKKIRIYCAALASVTVAVLAGCAAGPAGSAEVGTSQLDLAYFGSPVSAYTERYVEFADAVGESTGGELDILVRPEGELPYKPSEYIQRVGDGSVDLAGSLSSFASGECPLAGVFGLPMLVTDGDEWRAMSGVASSAVEPCLSKYGASELWSYGYPAMHIFGSGKTPTSIADLAGLQIRQTGPEWSEWIRGIGATPVTIETAEVGGALQQGVIDAIISTSDTVNSRWAEEIDWVFMLDLGMLSEYTIVNTSVLDSMPDSARTGLEEVSARFLAETTEHFEAADDAAQKSLEEEHDVKIVNPSGADRKQALRIAETGWESWAAALAGEDGVTTLQALRDALGK